ncbi:MAG: hypothetical protein Q9213_004963 [Squamulea squamosa]
MSITLNSPFNRTAKLEWAISPVTVQTLTREISSRHFGIIGLAFGRHWNLRPMLMEKIHPIELKELEAVETFKDPEKRMSTDDRATIEADIDILRAEKRKVYAWADWCQQTHDKLPVKVRSARDFAAVAKVVETSLKLDAETENPTWTTQERTFWLEFLEKQKDKMWTYAWRYEKYPERFHYSALIAIILMYVPRGQQIWASCVSYLLSYLPV